MAISATDDLHVPTTVGRASRVVGYDLARALAILGMVLVHFGLVTSADGWEHSALDPVMEFLDGRAAATFVMLAGIGISLRSNKVGASDETLGSLRTTLIRRGVYLFVCGMLLLIIWPGDILRVYGIAMLAAAWFVSARTSWLWTAIGGFIGGFLVLFASLGDPAPAAVRLRSGRCRC